MRKGKRLNEVGRRVGLGGGGGVGVKGKLNKVKENKGERMREFVRCGSRGVRERERGGEQESEDV